MNSDTTWASLVSQQPLSTLLDKALQHSETGHALNLTDDGAIHSLVLQANGYQVTHWQQGTEGLAQRQSPFEQEALSPITCQQVDWRSLRFNGSYQLILSFGTMMNIPAERTARLIADMQAATQRNGLNLIVAPLHTAERLTDKGLSFAFQSGELSHYYRKWQILSYDQLAQYSIILNGQIYHTTFATLLARKAKIKEG